MKEEDIDRMRELRLEGHTLEYIGAKYLLTRERVRQILRDTYGASLSSSRGLRNYLIKEITDYQWDAHDAEKKSMNIARRIETTIKGIPRLKVNKNDPLLALFNKKYPLPKREAKQ